MPYKNMRNQKRKKRNLRTRDFESQKIGPVMHERLGSENLKPQPGLNTSGNPPGAFAELSSQIA